MNMSGRAVRCIKMILLGLLFYSLMNTGIEALEYTKAGGTYSAARHDRFVPGTFPGNPKPNPTFFLANFESGSIIVVGKS